jgi:hypothetical protein
MEKALVKGPGGIFGTHTFCRSHFIGSPSDSTDILAPFTSPDPSNSGHDPKSRKAVSRTLVIGRIQYWHPTGRTLRSV